MEDVYVDKQFCISASGSSVSDLIRDYENGHRPLCEISLTNDPDFGVIKAGLITQENLGLTEPLEHCPAILRLRAGLGKIIAQVGRHSGDLPFDAVLVARGRVKAINLLALEREVADMPTFPELMEWMRTQLDKEGLRLRDAKNIFFVDGTCSSGMQVLNMAWKRIRRSLWSRVLLIGFDPYSTGNFSRLKTLGVLSDAPLPESPKVFQAGRDGFVKAECFVAAIVCSEQGLSPTAKVAQRCRIRASVMTNDAFSLTAIDADGRGLKECIEKVLHLGNLRPEQVSFIKAHGTGTQLNDRIESQVIREVFGHIPTITYKSQFGHTTNASGLFELILMRHCLETAMLKAVPLSQPVDPQCDILVPGADLKLKDPKFALGLSLGFGGINSGLVLERMH